ncbi:hypothetical protein BURPS1655_I0472 [Burkholderia pseudomallei 1655]|nr:hypothetical protein BURPS1655_I0472 [Burkholderia pseudomallei 1655]
MKCRRERRARAGQAPRASAWNHIGGARSIVFANGMRRDRCERPHSHGGARAAGKTFRHPMFLRSHAAARGQSRRSMRPLV